MATARGTFYWHLEQALHHVRRAVNEDIENRSYVGLADNERVVLETTQAHLEFLSGKA